MRVGISGLAAVGDVSDRLCFLFIVGRSTVATPPLAHCTGRGGRHTTDEYLRYCYAFVAIACEYFHSLA